VEDFKERLLALSAPTVNVIPSAECVMLRRVLRRQDAPQIMTALLKRELSVAGNADGTVGGSLIARGALISFLKELRARRCGNTRAQYEVAKELGCALEAVTGLVELGLLRAMQTPERVRILDDSIVEFKHRFVFLSVVAKPLGRRPRWLGRDCKRLGIGIRVIQVQKTNGEDQSSPKIRRADFGRLTLQTYSKKFKMAAIGRVQAGERAASVTRSLNLKPTDLYRWMNTLEKLGPERAFSGRGYWQTKRRAAAQRPRMQEKRVPSKAKAA
jgi:Transposase